MRAFKSLKPRLCHEILTIELQMILLESRGGGRGRGSTGPHYTSHHNQHRLAENQQLYPSCHQTLTKSKVGEGLRRSTEHRDWDWRYGGHELGYLPRVCGWNHHEWLDQLWQMSHFFIDAFPEQARVIISWRPSNFPAVTPLRVSLSSTSIPRRLLGSRHQICSKNWNKCYLFVMAVKCIYVQE